MGEAVLKSLEDIKKNTQKKIRNQYSGLEDSQLQQITKLNNQMQELFKQGKYEQVNEKAE